MLCYKTSSFKFRTPVVREYAKQNAIELNIENWPKWRELFQLVSVCKLVEGNKNTLAKFEMVS